LCHPGFGYVIGFAPGLAVDDEKADLKIYVSDGRDNCMNLRLPATPSVVLAGGLPSLLVGDVTHGDAVFEFGELESLPKD
jgi:hypothetical protein